MNLSQGLIVLEYLVGITAMLFDTLYFVEPVPLRLNLLGEPFNFVNRWFAFAAFQVCALIFVAFGIDVFFNEHGSPETNHFIALLMIGWIEGCHFAMRRIRRSRAAYIFLASSTALVLLLGIVAAFALQPSAFRS